MKKLTVQNINTTGKKDANLNRCLKRFLSYHDYTLHTLRKTSVKYNCKSYVSLVHCTVDVLIQDGPSIQAVSQTQDMGGVRLNSINISYEICQIYPHSKTLLSPWVWLHLDNWYGLQHTALNNDVNFYLRNRLLVGGGCVYVLQLFFFVLCFFPSTKTMRQPFSGTAERIFMQLLPNDRGEM